MDDRHIIQQPKKTNLQKLALVQVIIIAVQMFTSFIIAIYFSWWKANNPGDDDNIIKFTYFNGPILVLVVNYILWSFIAIIGIVLIIFSCTKKNNGYLDTIDTLGLLTGIFSLLLFIVFVAFILGIVLYVRKPQNYHNHNVINSEMHNKK